MYEVFGIYNDNHQIWVTDGRGRDQTAAIRDALLKIVALQASDLQNLGVLGARRTAGDPGGEKSDPFFVHIMDACRFFTNRELEKIAEGDYPLLDDDGEDLQESVKSSGKTQEFDTGAHRDSCEGKGDMSLIPWEPLQRLSIHFQNGAGKYGRNNWKKGMPVARYLDSAVRHIYKRIEGQTDEDHLAAAAWNVLCAMWTELHLPEMDEKVEK